MKKPVLHNYSDIAILCYFEGIEIKMNSYRENNKNTVIYTVYGGANKSGIITGYPAEYILNDFKKTEFHNETKEGIISLANLMEKYK